MKGIIIRSNNLSFLPEDKSIYDFFTLPSGAMYSYNFLKSKQCWQTFITAPDHRSITNGEVEDFTEYYNGIHYFEDDHLIIDITYELY